MSSRELWSAVMVTDPKQLYQRIVTHSDSDRTGTWPIDVGLVVTVGFAIVTRNVVLWFHVIFLLLVVAALTLAFRQFIVRLAVGMTVATALVIWAVASLSTPPEELTELPLLTVVLVLVFLVAQSRSLAANAREAAHIDLNLKADEQLDVLASQLELAQRLDLVGRTSAGLAHDLRNVFVVIRGCADELEASLDSSVRQAAADLLSASERGLSVIDDLLWIGKPHRHVTEEVDLGAVVSHLAPMLRRLTGRGVVLVVEVPHDGVRVDVDTVALSQILMNLVSNANDAIVCPTGRIVVAAKVVTTMSPDLGAQRTTVIEVSDDGPGFESSALTEAFAAGFTTKGAEHSGLGLATVWQLADRFGGTVQVESSVGGTTVGVSLPLDRTDVEAAETPGDADAVSCAAVVTEELAHRAVIVGSPTTTDTPWNQ